MVLEKSCLICGVLHKKPVNCSRKNWELKKYCSRACLDKSKMGNTYRRGKKHPNIWNKGKTGLQVAWNKGNGEYAKKLGFGKWMKGQHRQNSKSWKGDSVGYTALHEWLYRWLGQPNTCENCGKSGLTGHQIHWANKDHEYRRNRTDWIRLCAKCHKNYDKQFK